MFLCFNPSFYIELLNVSLFLLDPLWSHKQKVLYLQSSIFFNSNADYEHLQVQKRMIANFREEKKTKHETHWLAWFAVCATSHIKWVWLRFIPFISARRRRRWLHKILNNTIASLLYLSNAEGVRLLMGLHLSVRVSVQHCKLLHEVEMQRTNGTIRTARRRGRKKVQP